MRLRQTYILIALVLAGLIVQACLASPAFAYDAQGTVTSVNLLANNYAVSIDSFYYNISALPATSSVKVQFSQNNTTWFSSAGGSGLWDTLSTTGGASLSLSTLGWSGAAFYYKLQLNSTSDFTGTPVVDDIRLDYTPSGGFIFDTTGNLGIGTFAPTAKLTVVSSGTGTGTAFNVMNNAAASLMAILDNGKVGIGVTAPSAMLHASSTSATTITAILQGTVAQTANLLENRNNSGTFLSGFTASGGLLLNIASTTALAVQNGSGNAVFVVDSTNSRVGVATSTPGGYYGEKLTVVDSVNIMRASGGQETLLNVGTTTNTSILTVKSNGNVGIGTSSPNSRLTIYGTGGTGDIEIANSANAGGKLKFGFNDGTYSAYINGHYDATTHGTLSLYTGFPSPTEKLTIVDNGNVGIGQTSPAALLDVYRASGGQETLLLVGTSTSDSMFTVKSNGNVGIGTTSPVGKLTVATTGGTGSTAVVLETSNQSNSNSAIRWMNSAGTYQAGIGSYFGVADAGNLEFLNGSATNMILTSAGNLGIGYTTGITGKLAINGNVGIGQTSPAALLDVYRASGGQETLLLVGTSTSDSMFTVKSNGNVGIGTTTPAQKLDVEGGAILQNQGGATSQNILIGDPPGSGYPGIWFGAATAAPTYQNYSFLSAGSTGSGGGVLFNAPQGSNIEFRISNSTILSASDIGWLGGNNGVAINGAINTPVSYPFSVALSTGGTPSMVVDSSGNVGIGQTSPAALLDVYRASGGQETLLLVGTSTSDSMFTVKSNGNVGIGTSAPTYALDVNSTAQGPTVRFYGSDYIYGNSPSSGEIRLGNDPTQFGRLLYHAAGSSLNIDNTVTGGVTYVNVAGSTIAAFYGYPNYQTVLGSSGNVGIGQTSPAALLDVYRASGGQETLLLVGTSTSDSMFTVKSNGNVGIGTTGPNSPLVVGNDMGLMISGSNGVGTFTSTANDSAVYVGQASNGLGVMRWTRNATVGSAYMRIGTVQSNQLRLMTGYTDAVTIDTSGNVGIGQTSPAALLDVYRASGGQETLLLVGTSTSDSMFTVKSNGNVGIGTVAPNARLAVRAAGSTTGTAFATYRASDEAMRFQILDNGTINTFNILQFGADAQFNAGTTLQLDGGTAAAPSLNFGGSSDLDTGLYRVAANTIGFTTNGTVKAVLDASGNVGIGTTSPLEKLHIQGNVLIDGVGDPANYYLKIIPTTIAANKVGYAFTTKSYTGGTNTPLFLDNAGNVGIGQTSPAALLDVYRASGGQETLLLVGTSTSDSMFTVKSNGNVGIGTTSPSQKLDIQANIASGGFVGSQISDNGRSGANLITGVYSSGVWDIGGLWFGQATPSATNYAFESDTGGNSYFNAPTGAVYFGVANAYHMNMNANGVAINNGGTLAGTGVGLIVGSGNVGIGTTNPSGIFEVFAAGALRTTGQIKVVDKDVTIGNVSGTSGDTTIFKLQMRGGDTLVKNDTSGNLYLGMSSGSVNGRLLLGPSGDVGFGGGITGTDFAGSSMVIKSGNVGIGQTSPAALLDVYRASGGQETLLLVGTSTSDSMFTVKSNGNVGIGTTAPGSKLDIKAGTAATSTAVLIVRNSNDDIKFKVDDGGQIYSDYGTAATLAADLAEVTRVTGSSADYPDGTLLAIRPSAEVAGSIEPSGVAAPATLTSRPYQSNLYAVATARGTFAGGLIGADSKDLMALGMEGYLAKYNAVKASLTGYVKVRVSNINGAIESGDPLTSSSIPGVAMLADRGGRIIGFAREAFGLDSRLRGNDNYSEGLIEAYIAPQWLPGRDGMVLDEQNFSITSSGGIALHNSMSATDFEVGTSTASLLINQGDATSTPSNLLQLQTGGQDRFIVQNNGYTGILGRMSDLNAKLFVIENNGSEVFSITAKGDAAISYNLRVGGALSVGEHIHAGSDVAGQIVIEPGQTATTTMFAVPYLDTPIIALTPNGPVGGEYWKDTVTAKSVDSATTSDAYVGFSVRLAQAVNHSVVFDYLIMGASEKIVPLTVINASRPGSEIIPSSRTSQNLPDPSPTPTPTVTTSVTPTPTGVIEPAALPTDTPIPTATLSPQPTSTPEPTSIPAPTSIPEPTIPSP